MIETGNYFLDLLIALALDIRFQIIFFAVGFFHWNWRLPRPMKGAGNKAVFVTGCDTGMGHRMAKRFDEMKMYVFAGCLYPEGTGAKALKESCSERLHIVPLDITNEDQIKEAVAYVKANLPYGERGLYCLVNNAGVLPFTKFELMTIDMCEEAVNINLMGTIRMTKYFLPLISEVQGRIVTITSILARITFPNTTVYSATKHALNGFFTSLRLELSNQGIHVATIEPSDFSRTTDIMQWTQRRIEEVWKKMSPEEQQSKLHLYEETKKHTTVQKAPKEEQERNYKMLLEDVEDAMLAEEPYSRYVSARLTTRIALSLLRMMPEELAFKLISLKTTQN